MSRCQTSHAVPAPSEAKSLSSRVWPAATGVESISKVMLGYASLKEAVMLDQVCLASSLVLSCQKSTLPCAAVFGAPPVSPAPQAASVGSEAAALSFHAF